MWEFHTDKKNDIIKMIRLKVLSFGEGWERLQPVDEYKPAGSYEVEFNASSLTSGVYFYKLTTGSFSQSKKMVLMR